LILAFFSAALRFSLMPADVFFFPYFFRAFLLMLPLITAALILFDTPFFHAHDAAAMIFSRLLLHAAMSSTASAVRHALAMPCCCR